MLPTHKRSTAAWLMYFLALCGCTSTQEREQDLNAKYVKKQVEELFRDYNLTRKDVVVDDEPTGVFRGFTFRYRGRMGPQIIRVLVERGDGYVFNEFRLWPWSEVRQLIIREVEVRTLVSDLDRYRNRILGHMVDNYQLRKGDFALIEGPEGLLVGLECRVAVGEGARVIAIKLAKGHEHQFSKDRQWDWTQVEGMTIEEISLRKEGN